MDAPERSSLISDIRHAGETYGFPAAAGAVAAIIKAGRTVDRAIIESTAVPTVQINLTKIQVEKRLPASTAEPSGGTGLVVEWDCGGSMWRQ
jgi:hypothetical protein